MLRIRGSHRSPKTKMVRKPSLARQWGQAADLLCMTERSTAAILARHPLAAKRKPRAGERKFANDRWNPPSSAREGGQLPPAPLRAVRAIAEYFEHGLRAVGTRMRRTVNNRHEGGDDRAYLQSARARPT